MSPTQATVSQGSDMSTHYPTLMKLKTVDKEISMLTKAYESVHETSVMNMTRRHFVAAFENMEEMKQINDSLTVKEAMTIEIIMSNKNAEYTRQLKVMNTIVRSR